MAAAHFELPSLSERYDRILAMQREGVTLRLAQMNQFYKQCRIVKTACGIDSSARISETAIYKLFFLVFRSQNVQFIKCCQHGVQPIFLGNVHVGIGGLCLACIRFAGE